MHFSECALTQTTYLLNNRFYSWLTSGVRNYQHPQRTEEYVIHCDKTRFTKERSATRYGLWRRLDALSIRWHAPMKYYFYHARFSFYPKSQIRSNRTHRTLYPDRKTVYLHCSWRYSRCTGFLPMVDFQSQRNSLNGPRVSAASATRK